MKVKTVKNNQLIYILFFLVFLFSTVETELGSVKIQYSRHESIQMKHLVEY